MPFTPEEETELRRLLAQATPQELEEIAEDAAEDAMEAVEEAAPEDVAEVTEHASDAVEAEEAVEEAIDNGELEQAISETVEAVEESGNAEVIASGEDSDSGSADDPVISADAVSSDPVPDASPRSTHWYWQPWNRGGS